MLQYPGDFLSGVIIVKQRTFLVGGIRHAHRNRPLEIAPIRRQLGALLRVGDRRVDLMVRYGHAAPMPRSLRRPVSDVIIAT